MIDKLYKRGNLLKGEPHITYFTKDLKMIGKIRIKLALLIKQELNKRLNSENIKVSPSDLTLQPNGGSIFADWAKWVGKSNHGGIIREILGHSTMTECVKNGIDIDFEERVIQVTAKSLK